jgi:hypothetical protein
MLPLQLGSQSYKRLMILGMVLLRTPRSSLSALGSRGSKFGGNSSLGSKAFGASELRLTCIRTREFLALHYEFTAFGSQPMVMSIFTAIL